MARLNYNRPNGGYGRLSTAKQLPWAKPISPQQRKANATMKRNLARQHELANADPEQVHATHPATIRGGGSRYVLWCEQCRCEIVALTMEEYQTWRELNPPKIQRSR